MLLSQEDPLNGAMPINTGFKNFYKFRTTRNNVTLAKCVELVKLIDSWDIVFMKMKVP